MSCWCCKVEYLRVLFVIFKSYKYWWTLTKKGIYEDCWNCEDRSGEAKRPFGEFVTCPHMCALEQMLMNCVIVFLKQSN